MQQINSPYGQQIQKLIKSRNILLKVNRQHNLRQRSGMDDDETLPVRKKRNEFLILRSAHDGHENDREGGLICLHFESGGTSLFRLGLLETFGWFVQCACECGGGCG